MHAPGKSRLSKTRVELVAAGDSVTTVPYWTDGDPSGCFVDLRAHPDLIDQIAELDGRPALRDQIILLNESPSPFMTIACSCVTTRLFQQSGPPAWRTSSSCTLALADPERRDIMSYGSLARALHHALGSAPSTTRWNRVVELQPAPVVFHPDGRPTWSLTIRTHGYGLDSGTAAHEWRLCMLAQNTAMASWIRLQDLHGIEFLTACHREPGITHPRQPCPAVERPGRRTSQRGVGPRPPGDARVGAGRARRPAAGPADREGQGGPTR
jgi:hypothetical protein